VTELDMNSSMRPPEFGFHFLDELKKDLARQSFGAVVGLDAQRVFRGARGGRERHTRERDGSDDKLARYGTVKDMPVSQ
jgi:hypothetical protein